MQSPNVKLDEITTSLALEFNESNNILSFQEYLEIFKLNPGLHVRTASQYLIDMFDYYGKEPCRTAHDIAGVKFKLFEKKWPLLKNPIVGQWEAHEKIYNVISQFVKQGNVAKLLLLHGPNGSSKSSTFEAISSAMEEYSQTNDGAVYKFNWIFPNDNFEAEGKFVNSKRIGFNKNLPEDEAKSFAHLRDNQILCKIPSETKEHPILILPKKARILLYQSLLDSRSDLDLPTLITEGNLSSKNQAIFEALFKAYKGDLLKVLKHVQVERFTFSHRYKIGISSVEPQMSLDAQERVLSIERTLQNIPTVLQNIRLYELSGELISANRGIIEFSDLLKRPIEAFKYLLTAIERMSVSMESGTLDLDCVMIASSNEKHLDAFKSSPDWASFKGRFELVRVPYLLNSQEEARIYENDVKLIEKTKPIINESINILAKWAVLTRLRQPDSDLYPAKYKSRVNKLSPLTKLAIYNQTIDSLNTDSQDKKILKKLAEELKKEGTKAIGYEGRFGASPREMKMVLHFASQNDEYDCLHPIAIFSEIENLLHDKTVYDYLQFEPRNGYHDCEFFLTSLKEEYKDHFESIFFHSLALFDSDSPMNSFQVYLKHCVAFVKKEKVRNEVSGDQDDPSETIMTEVEELMGVPDKKEMFRESIISKIASWKVDNPNDQVDIAIIFSEEIEKIKHKLYQSRKDLTEQIKGNILKLYSDDFNKCDQEIIEKTELTFENLRKNYSYSRRSSWQSLIFCEKLNRSHF